MQQRYRPKTDGCFLACPSSGHAESDTLIRVKPVAQLRREISLRFDRKQVILCAYPFWIPTERR